ncbi:IS66 family insertion sequence element accessory protein TnpA [Massilia sp. S19_KUP03_FR1]|uniref:IS66 family insertion sequence element accessory protein TnpA n=1 Tax=Massilia sp. S19_KUP03_FR1 TaxID=3025503 RepID=UPI002FCDAB11
MEGDTEFWTSHVEALRRDGGAASEYPRQHGLALASLYYWRRKVQLAAADSAGGGVAAPGKFVALRVLDVSADAATCPCTLVLRSALRLELAALPSPCWLLALEQSHAGAR